jgi:hypothetical protein
MTPASKLSDLDIQPNLSIVSPGNNGSAVADHFMTAIYNASDYELLQISRDPDLSLEAMSHLFPKYPQELIENPSFIAATNHSPSFVSDLFVLHKEVISNLRINDDWAKCLFNHHNEEVRYLTAANPSLPDSLWDFCMHHHDHQIQMGIAANPALGYGELAQLSGVKSPAVRSIAAAQITNRFPAVAQPSATLTTPEPSHDFLMPMTTFQVDNTEQIEIKRHPLIFIFGGLVLICIASIATIFGSQSTPSSVQVKGAMPVVTTTDTRASVKTTSGLNAINPYDRAIEYANEATARTRKVSEKNGSEYKSEWSAIVGIWDNSIKALQEVEKGSPDYEKAQAKMRNYSHIRAVAIDEAKART